MHTKHFKIGLSGTGFIAKSFARLLEHHDQFTLTHTLSRRPANSITGFPYPDSLTQNIDQLIDSSDIVVECSGDAIHATVVIEKAMQAGLPVITMNSEFHVTTGSWFVDKGYLSEAEGDQPGCLAALHEEVIDMGFKPLVYGNLKGFLNKTPTKEDMLYWSKRQGISIEQTTAFTDGSKVQIEQALVANGLGASITQQGLSGLNTDNFESTAKELAHQAKEMGAPISDYLISKNTLPPGVFIAAEHDMAERDALNYYKLGNGPFYVLTKHFHLCAFEMVKTLKRYTFGIKPLLNNALKPTVSVASIAKHTITKDTIIEKSLGGFDIRGEALNIKDEPQHVPIGVLNNARFIRDVGPGQIITYADVELPESRALTIVQELYT